MDKVTALESGTFDIMRTWELGYNRIVSWGGQDVRAEKVSDYLEQGEFFIAADLLCLDNDGGPEAVSMLKIDDRAYMLDGDDAAFVGVEKYYSDILSFDADFMYFDGEMIFLSGAKRLVLNGKLVFSSEEPLTQYIIPDEELKEDI